MKCFNGVNKKHVMVSFILFKPSPQLPNLHICSVVDLLGTKPNCSDTLAPCPGLSLITLSCSLLVEVKYHSISVNFYFI